MHKRGYVLLCLDNKTQSGSILELVNKLDSNIVYGNDTSFTKYGSFGIKVWFSYK